MERSRTFAVAVSLCLGVVVASVTPSSAQAPKYGGHLNLMQREELSQGFAIHETSTIATSFPSLPCFNTLVVFDQGRVAEVSRRSPQQQAGPRFPLARRPPSLP